MSHLELWLWIPIKRSPFFFFFSSRRRHTRLQGDWSSDVCSSDLVCEAGGFLKTKSDLPAPDLQLNFGPAFYVNHGFTRPTGHGFSIGPSLIRPRSRGRIALLSSDPLEPPLIQPNYFFDDADRHVLVRSVGLAPRSAR